MELKASRKSVFRGKIWKLLLARALPKWL